MQYPYLFQEHVELLPGSGVQHSTHSPNQSEQYGRLEVCLEVLLVVLWILLDRLRDLHVEQVEGGQHTIELSRLDKLAAEPPYKGLALQLINLGQVVSFVG